MDDGYRALGVLARGIKSSLNLLVKVQKKRILCLLIILVLIPVLIKAVQEQQSEIEELKQQQSLITSLTPEEIILLKEIDLWKEIIF